MKFIELTLKHDHSIKLFINMALIPSFKRSSDNTHTRLYLGTELAHELFDSIDVVETPEQIMELLSGTWGMGK